MAVLATLTNLAELNLAGTGVGNDELANLSVLTRLKLRYPTGDSRLFGLKVE